MNSISRCQPLLGTYVEISIMAEANENSLLEMSSAAFNEIANIHQLMSFHDLDSELSMLNRCAYLEPCIVSSHMLNVLSQALTLSHLTNGLYDISIAPSLIKSGHLPNFGYSACESANWQNILIHNDAVFFEKRLIIDLGGIAKGYAVDRAIALFDEETHVVINAGGDLRMTDWQSQHVSIRHCAKNGISITELPMLSAAVATSANYYMEGAGAIIHPITKVSMTNNLCYSVFAKNCMLADALTKVAFLSETTELVEALGAHLVITGSDVNSRDGAPEYKCH